MAVACSGGRDSMALLHATVRAVEPLGLRVAALHVHHGLSPNADAWSAHVERRCRRWSKAGQAVVFACERLATAPPRGASVEAWAREARQAALVRLARAAGAGVVLLAHHRRDQAETFLLQALRGAGVAGLAGMARAFERGGIRFMRPWLDTSPDVIAAYVRAHRIRHVVDESNGDRRYDRNRLRLDVWPALEQAFAQTDAMLARAATWAHDASEAIAAGARRDLVDVTSDGALEIARWSALEPPRATQALRAWLHSETGAPAPATLVERLRRELPDARRGRWPWPQGELRLYRGRLRVVRDAAGSLHGAPAASERALAIDAPGVYRVPGWGGSIEVEPVEHDGVALDALRDVELVPRRGGERWQAGPGRPPRSLKHQYQAAGVPAWERGGPLLYAEGRLLYVPGLGLDARACAAPGDARVRLHWLPDEALEARR